MNQATIANYKEVITKLHAIWTPHSGQVQIGKALIKDGIKDIMIQAGRSFGKSELMTYLLWRWAMLNPGSESYYFAPYMKQAREILWASKRVQHFGPSDWLASPPNNTEMRLNFKNGSFIKLDGSDNVEAYRGIKPKGLSVLDEFKDFRVEFFDAYDPNRARHDAPMIIIGTPPDHECQFTELSNEYQKNPSKRFFWAPTELNPHIPKAWLENKKAELYARGEGDVWEREYMARFIRGSAATIFPMLNKEMVKDHDYVMRSILRDKNKLEYYLCADPAGATCFAVLFIAINPYSRTVYCLDEIYETNQSEMTVKSIGERIISKRVDINHRAEWRQIYDEAATWFANEMLDHHKESFEPSDKAHNDKMEGLSLIKDIMLANKFVISDKCQKLYWEMDRYRKDAQGRIPKKDDHLIDALRYSLAAARYDMNAVIENEEMNDPMWRGATIAQDMEGWTENGKIDDWSVD